MGLIVGTEEREDGRDTCNIFLKSPNKNLLKKLACLFSNELLPLTIDF